MIKHKDDFANVDGTRVLARIVTVTIALVLALGCLASVPRAMADGADNALPTSGVIDVSYINDDMPIDGAHLAVYRVAQWRASGGYEPTGSFVQYADSIDWDGLLNADSETFRVIAQTLSSYAQRDGIAADAEAITDADGRVSFGGLSKGLYLISAARYEGVSGAGENIVCDASALLVALPANTDASDDDMHSGTGENRVNEGQTMHVVLSPKTECTAVPQPQTVALTVHKVWKNDAGQFSLSPDRPASITVQLLRDGKVLDTAQLDASNGWKHTWTSLESGHDWRVVESQVPAQYLVSIDREGAETLITNTHVTSADTGSNIVGIVVLTAVIAVASIGLLICLMVRGRLRND